jgi:hypothetical protein
MEQVQIGQDDIDSLAERLDQAGLSEKEKLLLSAIITMASKVVEVEIPITEVPSFKDQFDAAFTPSHAEFLLSYAKNHVSGWGDSGLSIRPHPDTIKP